MDPKILINIAVPLLMGSLTAYVAKQRGRDMMLWFVLGFFFSLIPLIILFLLPPLDQEGNEISKKTRETRQEIQEISQVPLSVVDESLTQGQWYYLDEKHAQFGPITIFALQDLWKSQTITLNTYVWKEGMENWKHIKDFSDLLHLLQSH